MSRDGPLLDTRAPAFTPVIDRGPAQWRSSGSHGPTAGEQDECDMLLIFAMLTDYTRNKTSLYEHTNCVLVSKVEINIHIFLYDFK